MIESRFHTLNFAVMGFCRKNLETFIAQKLEKLTNVAGQASSCRGLAADVLPALPAAPAAHGSSAFPGLAKKIKVGMVAGNAG